MRIISQLSGDGAVFQTVQQMKQLINEGSIDPLIRKHAFLATRHCDRSDNACKIHSILSYVKGKMEYTFDPSTYELLQHPKLLIKAIDLGRVVYGDCDDFSMLISSMLKSIGLKSSLKVIGIGNHYQHVYVMSDGYRLDGTSEDISEKPYYKSFEVKL